MYYSKKSFTKEDKSIEYNGGEMNIPLTPSPLSPLGFVERVSEQFLELWESETPSIERQ
jgi:hypothetical protein